ncbi:MAG: hypothetical protein JNL79_18360 [Myxococcales bacterium]|nr:hypothetical protein [Myxococcales bacterium]
MRTLLSCLLALSLVGCGSSVDPAQPDTGLVDTGVAETPAPKPAARTLETVGLLPGPAQNMVLDWTFREAGWGAFLAITDGSFSQATLPVRVLTDSPGGASAPVALFKDPTGTVDKSRGVTATCVLVGGKGPFEASVWVSRSTFAGEPVEWADDLGSASITTQGPKLGKAYPLTVDPSRTRKVGDRTWVQLRARIDATLETAFFVIQSSKNGVLWVTAPWIVPVELTGTPGTTTKSWVPGVAAREPSAAELQAIRDYVRLVKPVLVPGGKAAVDLKAPGKPKLSAPLP